MVILVCHHSPEDGCYGLPFGCENCDRVRDVTILPDCMSPDGAQPCRGYQQAAARLKRIAEIIEAVDNRCMAVDGSVPPTLQEMHQQEISEIYDLALGRRSVVIP